MTRSQVIVLIAALAFGTTAVAAFLVGARVQAQSALAPRGMLPMLACDSCSGGGPATPSAVATSSPGTSTPRPPPTTGATATVTPDDACASATAEITALDKVAERVVISGSGDLSDWAVVSEAGNQRFEFPDGYQLNGSVVLVSGPGAVANPPGQLLFAAANVWNNSSDDDAFLYDCRGSLRSVFEDGS